MYNVHFENPKYKMIYNPKHGSLIFILGQAKELDKHLVHYSIHQTKISKANERSKILNIREN